MAISAPRFEVESITRYGKTETRKAGQVAKQYFAADLAHCATARGSKPIDGLAIGERSIIVSGPTTYGIRRVA